MFHGTCQSTKTYLPRLTPDCIHYQKYPNQGSFHKSAETFLSRPGCRQDNAAVRIFAHFLSAVSGLWLLGDHHPQKVDAAFRAVAHPVEMLDKMDQLVDVLEVQIGAV